MAANGNLIAIANYNPAEIVTYNVKTKREKTLPDPYGGPVDVAIGKQGSVYAMNSTTSPFSRPGRRSRAS